MGEMQAPAPLSPLLLDLWHAQAPDLVRESIEYLVQEHCVGGRQPAIWRALSPLLPAIAPQVATLLLARRQRCDQLYSRAGGNALTAAHLIVVASWDKMIREVCVLANHAEWIEALTNPHRPRGGYPLFDDAQRTLQEMADRFGEIA
jgi:hypothetical protein